MGKGRRHTPPSRSRFHRSAKRAQDNLELRVGQEIKPVTVRKMTPEELAAVRARR